MPEPDWSVYCLTAREVDSDGPSSKVVRFQSEIGHRVAGQHCHVHVLRRGTAGLSPVSER